MRWIIALAAAFMLSCASPVPEWMEKPFEEYAFDDWVSLLKHACLRKHEKAGYAYDTFVDTHCEYESFRALLTNNQEFIFLPRDVPGESGPGVNVEDAS